MNKDGSHYLIGNGEPLAEDFVPSGHRAAPDWRAIAVEAIGLLDVLSRAGHRPSQVETLDDVRAHADYAVRGLKRKAGL
jgi:hypothetical protein